MFLSQWKSPDQLLQKHSKRELTFGQVFSACHGAEHGILRKCVLLSGACGLTIAYRIHESADTPLESQLRCWSYPITSKLCGLVLYSNCIAWLSRSSSFPASSKNRLSFNSSQQRVVLLQNEDMASIWPLHGGHAKSGTPIQHANPLRRSENGQCQGHIHAYPRKLKLTLFARDLHKEAKYQAPPPAPNGYQFVC